MPKGKYVREFFTDRPGELMREIIRRVMLAREQNPKFSTKIEWKGDKKIEGKGKLIGPQKHHAEIDDLVAMFERKLLK